MATYLALYASDMGGAGEVWTLVSPAPIDMEIEWDHTDESSRMLYKFPGSDHLTDLPVQPYQKVVLVRMDTKPPQTRSSISESPVFYGRVNDVRPVVDTGKGRRTWELTVRDFTQFLADNYVRPGQWNLVGLAPWDTGWSSGDWTPDYVARNPIPSAGSAGETRERIIREVVCNCLPESVRGVDTQLAERSITLRITNNYNYLGELHIMDLVAGLAKEHPWDASDPPKGVGHFFRQAYGHDPATQPTTGNLADAWFIYARRDQYMWEADTDTTLFAQGKGAVPQLGTGFDITLPFIGTISVPVPINATRVIRVTDYDFPAAGHDIFSRSYVFGRGDNVDASGTTDHDMETTWDPATGKYAVHREIVEYDESSSDPYTDSLSQPKLREKGLLLNYPITLRGPKEGWIEVAGLPFSRTVGGILRDQGTVPPIPGYVVRVWLKDIGMVEAEAYFVERLVWKFPSNVTRLYLNRRNFKNIDRVLMGHGIKGKMNTTGVKDFYSSGWQNWKSTGNTFTHDFGIVPHRVDVYAVSPNPDGTPNLSTLSKVPYGAYDPVQGQYYGFMTTKITDKVITIITAANIAYSDGAGRWLQSNDSPPPLVIAIATPL